ncbi:MAG TPA: ABC transporter ATP-binding protein [Candidatus Dormibacteraeota bacterium]|nr:ABC transporter ATP-binding protein [Candidatus Dormibacteraeota bacterium]
MHEVRALELDNAAVRLGGRVVWSGVDLEIARGEFVAVLGPNAAGKSTLLRALLGVVPLSEGTVEVFGRPVRRGNEEIGYLPQRRRFDPDLRIRAADLVRLGLDGGRWGLPAPSPDKARRVAATLELVGATAYQDRPIGELSGGEQQRILIAQALVGGARMLALDEPLESLDLNNQQAISELIRGICRAQAVTVLLVAHDVNPILPFIDRVVYVAGGRVLAGRPEEVIRTETLTELYGAPVEVLHTSDGRLVVVGQYEPVTHHPDDH